MLPYLFVILLFCVGCSCPHLKVKREFVGRVSLASTFVESPDPRQENPPKGEKLIIMWRGVDVSFPNILLLQVLYRDLTEEKFTYSIDRSWGIKEWDLLDAEYEKRKGVLAYKASLQQLNGAIVAEYTHALFVKTVDVDAF